MSSKSLVICDEDVNYAARLAAFFNGKRELAFQVKICGNPVEMQNVLTDNAKSILLLNESFVQDELVKEWQGELLILSETKRTSNYEEKERLFKYQSGSKILLQILEKCGEQNMDGVWRVRKSSPGRVIGFFSPVRRVGQTTFAMTKSKELSKDCNVLYINLEAYAGCEGLFSQDQDRNMSTLLYYAKQESDNVGMILTTVVCSKNGVDYIPPVKNSEDLHAVTKDEWLWLFRELLRNSIYDVLVLDLSECIQGLYEILKFCDEVYMLTADDQTAASKIKQYEQDLRQMGYLEVAERMIRCDIRRTIAGKNSGQSGPVKRN